MAMIIRRIAVLLLFYTIFDLIKRRSSSVGRYSLVTFNRWCHPGFDLTYLKVHFILQEKGINFYCLKNKSLISSYELIKDF